MSWILITVLIIIALFGYIGYRKGLLRIVISIASLIISILATMFLAPLISGYIKENTSVYQNMNDKIYDLLKSNHTYENILSQTAEYAPELDADKYKESVSEVSAYVSKVTEALNLPDSIIKKINVAVSEETLLNAINKGADSVQSAVTYVVAAQLTSIIFYIMIYMIIFVIIFIILRIITSAAGIISHLPVVHQLNKSGGLVLGLFEGLIIVWILFAVITVFSSQSWAAEALSDISSNKITEFIYNNNLILKVIFNKF